MATATETAAPRTLADIEDLALYTLAEAARVLRQHPDTLLKNGIVTQPRKGRTSRHFVLGRNVLTYAGLKEIERSHRTSEGGETQAEREKRAAAAVEELKRVLAEKGKPQGRRTK